MTSLWDGCSQRWNNRVRRITLLSSLVLRCSFKGKLERTSRDSHFVAVFISESLCIHSFFFHLSTESWNSFSDISPCCPGEHFVTILSLALFHRLPSLFSSCAISLTATLADREYNYCIIKCIVTVIHTPYLINTTDAWLYSLRVSFSPCIIPSGKPAEGKCLQCPWARNPIADLFSKGYNLNYFPQTITNSANSASGIDLQEPTLKYLFVFIPARYF